MSKKEKFKDVLVRALKTFWQSCLGYIIINIHVIADAITTDLEVGGFETLKSVGLTVGVGAIAAGLSALYNGVIKPLIEKPKDYSDDEMGFEPLIEETTEAEVQTEELVEEVEGEGIAEDDEVGFDEEVTDTDAAEE